MTEERTEPQGPPTPEDFFLRTGLYTRFPLRDNNESHAAGILGIEFYPGSLKALCVNCGEESVFRTDRIQSGELTKPQRPHSAAISNSQQVAYRATLDELAGCQPWSHQYAFSNHFFSVQFYCSRDFSHRLLFTGAVADLVLLKTGQFPSFADLASNQVSRYRKVLGAERSREYTRAINLFSHDIGIGSLVYLRRILESLIEEAHAIALTEPNWDDTPWVRLRVQERIKFLGSHVPSFLRENEGIHAILSKGVHELTEQQCLLHFPVLRSAIDLILEERLAVIESESKRKEISRALGEIRGRLGKEVEPSST